MKIIQISPYYYPHLGGMEACVKEISEKLAKKKHQVKVYASDVDYKKGEQKLNNKLVIHYLKTWEFAHTPIIPSLLFNLLTIPKDCIMHVHIAQSFVPEIVWLISKIRKIPYIAQVHVDIKPTGRMGFLLPIYKKVFLKVVLRSASRIVVPTKDYVAIISKKYRISRYRIIVIPYGVDLNNFKSKASNLHNPIKLLFVGRLTKQKNVPLLIKSLKKIVDRNDFNIELHIVGEGEDKDKIMLLIKTLKLDKKVFLHGSLSGDKLYSIYSNSDIFILTSVYESFGIVLLEAMASGLPIVASNIPAVRNVIKNNYNGLLVKPSPKEITKSILKILNSPVLRNKLIENGLSEVKKYNWNKIVSKFAQTYKEVLDETN